VEAFFIPKALKSTTGAEQSQGAAVFFDCRGIVHHSYTPAGQTINKEYYLEVIRHFHDAVWRKRRTCGPHAIGSCIMTMPRLIHHT
jgi:hypothetical protein